MNHRLLQQCSLDEPLSCQVLCCVQVQEELQKAASKTQDVEERQKRLQVDKQRLDIQLAQAKEGNEWTSLNWLKDLSLLHVYCIVSDSISPNSYNESVV